MQDLHCLEDFFYMDVKFSRSQNSFLMIISEREWHEKIDKII
jgi:hypothetical protein